MQTRLIDYGSNVLSSQIIAIQKATHVSGVLTPTPILSINGSNIQVNPYQIVTPDGVIITEDQTQLIPGPTSNTNFLTSAAENYTIIVRHVLAQTTGGSAALIEVVSNLFAIDSFTDATVLGWLVYPGGSVVLDSTMLYAPRPLKIQESSNDQNPTFQMSAPFTTKWLTLNSDPGVATVDGYLSGKAYTKVTNANTIIVQSAVYVIPVVNGQYPPSTIRLSVRADFQSAVTVSILDENGTQYIPGNNIIANTDWGVFDVKLGNYYGLDLFKPHTTWTIRLSFQLNPGTSLDIQSVSVYDYNLPTGVAFLPSIQYTFTFVRISSVLNFFNPSLALPVAPNLGDRYIASTGGNGWLKSHIYEWSGSVWTDTTPVQGNVVRITQTMPVEDFVFSGDFALGWINQIPEHLILV